MRIFGPRLIRSGSRSTSDQPSCSVVWRPILIVLPWRNSRHLPKLDLEPSEWNLHLQNSQVLVSSQILARICPVLRIYGVKFTLIGASEQRTMSHYVAAVFRDKTSLRGATKKDISISDLCQATPNPSAKGAIQVVGSSAVVEAILEMKCCLTACLALFQ